ncbi:hypothetical protein M1293_02895 [Candidatus Parvarchaeota archaeon]|nr:hypothetical protein [Candidatus Parvarchaeota archaeon]
MAVGLFSSESLSEKSVQKIFSRKLDSINGIQMYVGKKGEVILFPTEYPSSINPLVRAISSVNSAVFIVNRQITGLDAELAVAIENSKIERGIVLYSVDSDMDSFSRYFRGYKVGSFEKISLSDFSGCEETVYGPSSFKYASIDKHFIVKGIGSVIIGFDLAGEIKKGDRMFLLPSLKEVSVKSIQVMDKDTASCLPGQHVGLALNNASQSDIESNYGVSSSNEISEDYDVSLEMSEFYKENDIYSRDLACAVYGNDFSLRLKKDQGGLHARFNKKALKTTDKLLLADPSLPPGRNRVLGSIRIL